MVARHQDDKWPQDEGLQPLTKLTLDKLSLWGRILRRHGFIRDGYVLDMVSEK